MKIRMKSVEWGENGHVASHEPAPAAEESAPVEAQANTTESSSEEVDKW